MFYRKMTVDHVPYEVLGMNGKIEVKGLGSFKLPRNKFSVRNLDVVEFIRKKKSK